MVGGRRLQLSTLRIQRRTSNFQHFQKSAVFERFLEIGFSRSIFRYPFYCEQFRRHFMVFFATFHSFTVSVKLCDKWL